LQWRHKQFLKNPPLEKGELLDIGCGPAEFLNECRKIGFSVLGADIAPRNVAAAKESYGIEVVQGGAGEVLVKYPERKFDIITFFEIVEHLADPVGFFKEVKSILKPGGFIVMSVPNSARFGGLFEKEENPPNHLLRWKKESLGKFLSKEDFCNIRILEQPISFEYPMVRGWFSFGIIKPASNNRKNSEGSDLPQVGSYSKKEKILKYLAYFKNKLAVPLSAVLMIPLGILGVKYWDMYAVARLSDNKK